MTAGATQDDCAALLFLKIEYGESLSIGVQYILLCDNKNVQPFRKPLFFKKIPDTTFKTKYMIYVFIIIVRKFLVCNL